MALSAKELRFHVAVGRPIISVPGLPGMMRFGLGDFTHAFEDLGHKIEDTGKDVGQKIQDAGEDAGNALKNNVIDPAISGVTAAADTVASTATSEVGRHNVPVLQNLVLASDGKGPEKSTNCIYSRCRGFVIFIACLDTSKPSSVHEHCSNVAASDTRYICTSNTLQSVCNTEPEKCWLASDTPPHNDTMDLSAPTVI